MLPSGRLLMRMTILTFLLLAYATLTQRDCWLLAKEYEELRLKSLVESLDLVSEAIQKTVSPTHSRTQLLLN